MNRSRSLCAGGLAVALSLLAAGCGGPPTGTVTGKVTFKGEGINWGTVGFVAADGRAISGQFNSEGTFTSRAPIGPGKLTVQTYPLPPSVQPPDKPQPPPQAGLARYTEIPAKYADARTSGLDYTVKAGPQTHEVDLKPDEGQ